MLENESQLPKWLRRDRYAPTEEEMDAVMVSLARLIPPLKWRDFQAGSKPAVFTWMTVELAE